MPEARVRLYRIHYTLYIYVLCVCECVLSFVSFSPDHFNPCVGGHCFCSSLPHSLSCSPALSLSLLRSSAVFYLLYFSFRPCVLRFVSLSLCVFLSACSYLSHCLSLSRSLVRSFSLSPCHCRRQTVWRVGVVHVGCAHCIYTGCIHYVRIMAHT